MDELHEIRRIWLNEKHEFDDSLPRIYEEVTGEEFPRQRRSTATALRAEDWDAAQGGLRRRRGVLRPPGAPAGHRAKPPRHVAPGRASSRSSRSRFRAGIYASKQEAVDDLTERDRRTLEAKERAKGEVELPSRPVMVEQQLGLLRDDLERVGE